MTVGGRPVHLEARWLGWIYYLLGKTKFTNGETPKNDECEKKPLLQAFFVVVSVSMLLVCYLF